MQLNWKNTIGHIKQASYFIEMMDYIAKSRENGEIIYPAADAVFSAFKITELDQVKIVILGQDPYHGPNQAHGLSFSVLPGVQTPPSLMNIYKELSQDIANFTIPNHGYLIPWAEQGVLLLNTVLTVVAGQAHSHKQLAWERFTDTVIQVINDNTQGIIFLLWGAHAKKKGQLIDRNRHHILTAPHPSPLSVYRGFFGCQHFSKANKLLEIQNKNPICWQLPML